MPPTNPMSWYGGSQLTPTSCAEGSNPQWINSELCQRFACVSRTPLGSAVEPEVYWMMAGESASRRGGVHAVGGRWPTSSVASQSRPASSGTSSACAAEEMAESLSATCAQQSAANARSRGSVRASRDGSGG